MPPFQLVFKNLFKHRIRSILTVASIAVALFLLCVLRSLVVSLDAGVRASAINRLIVQSSVSLFVYLPESYEEKLRQVDGVENICAWNWFGGYYQEQSNFFAQFATDAESLLDVYPEITVVEGSRETFETERGACLVGKSLVERFGFAVGDTIPIVGTLFPRADGRAWDFKVAGIYESSKPNVDQSTLFFHDDYLQKTLESGEASGPEGVGLFVLKTRPGVDQTALMSEVDALFENGPQRVQTTTEAEFQAQFVSMIGNVPLFVASIGSGVMLAILLAALNTMLMAAREQTRDVGVLKALGFSDGRVFGVMMIQSLVLCGMGGLIGVGLSKFTEPLFVGMLGTYFPGYAVTNDVMLAGALVTLATGIVAGIVPALNARKLPVIQALRATA
jgi:putative ABC transport system permease protein